MADNGRWDVAWPSTGVPDPRPNRRLIHGMSHPAEVAAQAAFIREVHTLEEARAKNAVRYPEKKGDGKKGDRKGGGRGGNAANDGQRSWNASGRAAPGLTSLWLLRCRPTRRR